MPIAAVCFLVVVGVVVPAAAVHTARRLPRALHIPRPTLFASIVFNQAILCAFGVWAAWAAGLALFPMPAVDLLRVGCFLALVVPGVVSVPNRWRRKSGVERERLWLLLPHRPRDIPLWLAVCVCAGVVEEFVYRGVLASLLRPLVGSTLAACAISVVVFAVAHALQGFRAVLLIAMFAAAFHASVVLTGDLYTAIAGHVAYDFLAGLMVMQLERRAAGIGRDGHRAGAGPDGVPPTGI